MVRGTTSRSVSRPCCARAATLSRALRARSVARGSIGGFAAARVVRGVIVGLGVPVDRAGEGCDEDGAGAADGH
eukprot:11800837-Alexandrium_andersonii.AAC.1